MKKNDIVEWKSQAAGSARLKRGTIVQVVAAGHRPNASTRPPGIGLQRKHESYVVRASVVDGSEGQAIRTKLYWPQVIHLKLVAAYTRAP